MGKDHELLEGARKGNVAVVEKILGQKAKRSGPLASLRRGPGANVQDSSGYSALHHAALNGHREIVKLLLEHEASTNIVDNKGSSPLHLAAWSGNPDIVKLLLNGPSICNVNLTTKDDETALHCAAQYGHTRVASLLLEHACDPGIRNCHGETALDLAAQYGRLECVELLVRADPTLIYCLRRTTPDTVYPHTPLHLASRNGHRAVVEVLLRAGFNVNIRTKAGTALHEAALCGKVEVVKTLLLHGVNPAIRDSNNYTVMDLLSLFNTAQASQEIMGILKRHRKSTVVTSDSDGDSINNHFLTSLSTDSDIGSPYENLRPLSKNSHSFAIGLSPNSMTPSNVRSFQTHTRPPEGFEDDTQIVFQMRNNSVYQSLPLLKRKLRNCSDGPMNGVCAPLEGITFSFGEQLHLQNSNKHCGTMIVLDDSNSTSSRESDSSLYMIPCAPKAFMDSNDVNYLSTSRESDQISLASTVSSSGCSRRPDNGSVAFSLPITSNRSGHSPCSISNKISPTPPKKPPRRNLSVSPSHSQTMSSSMDGVGDDTYEYLFMASSGTKSQTNLLDLDHEFRREHLSHGRSVDHCTEISSFDIALDDSENRRKIGATKELQRGKSEDLDCRKHVEPVAITSVYQNMVVKQQNPKRKLKRAPDVYEQWDLKSNSKDESISQPSQEHATYVSNAFIMIDQNGSHIKHSFPMSPTHYKQPPTPEHPPPSARKAESLIHEKIRPLSQEYKRQSRDIETEIDEEYLIPYNESSDNMSISSRSLENVVEEYQPKRPFAGLRRGSSRVLSTKNSNTTAERPKTLKKFRRAYDANNESSNTDGDISSSSEREYDDKENDERAFTLSPFDEQEEWAKIQEIMASFGTGVVHESVFVAELEREFQSRLMNISCPKDFADSTPLPNIQDWLAVLELPEYEELFVNNGFDDLDYLNGILDESTLIEIGISEETKRQTILEAVEKLTCKIDVYHDDDSRTVEIWLKQINLEQYCDTFKKHLYTEMEKVKSIWDVELSTVLDIEKIGHRKRMLASLLHENKTVEQCQVNNEYDSSMFENNTGTIRYKHKKTRPAPQPPNKSTACEIIEPKDPSPTELMVGGSNSIKSQWRHQPILLITGVVQYIANYIGSTKVRDFKGIESTKKCIQKLSATKQEPTYAEVILSISYRGVNFFNPLVNKTICDHNIKNINSVCQDNESQVKFGYITKDGEAYFCHVFEAATREEAAEVILTLGQAFELAYQMALRDQVTGKTTSGKSNSKTGKPISDLQSRNIKEVVRTNGHPIKMLPLALSIAADPPLRTKHQASV